MQFRFKILINTKEIEAPQAKILKSSLKILINTKEIEAPQAGILKSGLKILIKYNRN